MARRRRRFAIARRRTYHFARRGVSAAGRAARTEKHTIAAVGTALAVGYLQAKGANLPYVKQVGMAGTYGIGLWALGRWTHNQTLAHMATGLLAVQAAIWGSEAASGGMTRARGRRVSGMGDPDEVGQEEFDV